MLHKTAAQLLQNHLPLKYGRVYQADYLASADFAIHIDWFRFHF